MRRIFSRLRAADATKREGVCSAPKVRTAAWASALSLLFLFSCLLQSAEEMSAPEDQVKAACLLNIPKYVTWPEKTFASSNSPVVLCLLGQQSFRSELQRIAAIRTAAPRRVLLKDIDPDADSPAPCPIVFISNAEKRRFPEILSRFRNAPVLTVGEADNFISAGGIINMMVRDKRVRLQVNLRAAEAAGLKISSKLLQVAEVVGGDGK